MSEAPSTRVPARRRRERGGVLATLTHVVLLVFVLGQVVYLASRHRLRWDLTSDQMWSLTDSTRDLVARLEKQLLIEAYFSPKENLPVTMRDTRVVLDNFLDELVQLGAGRVVVQRYDPNGDKAISDRCTRIGVQPVDLRGGSATSVSFDRHWQGLRFVYGGSKQKVLGQLAPPSSFVAEALITPSIKEVVTSTKRKFGFMEWPATNPGQQQGLGWNVLRSHEGITKRFEFQNYKSEDGALVPEDVDTLFLFRPSGLTDRQKYVIDQFVVGGGTLVVFADASEYTIGQRRQLTRTPLLLDAPESSKKLVDQLSHYGIDWKPKVLADMSQDAFRPRNIAQPQEYFSLEQQNIFGGKQFGMVAYPYYFHAVAVDWSQLADRLARDAGGQLDETLAERYRKEFKPGMPSDEFLFTTFKKIGRGPGFYWPTWVGLRRKAGGALDLPAGVEGRVHLWSSPAVLAEDPPATLNPLGFGDPRTQVENHKKFLAKLNERFTAEPRQQAPLMSEVSGRFTSFFADGERPLRPSEQKELEAREAAEAKAAEEAADQPGEGEKPEPAAADPIGPEPPPQQDAEKPAVEPERDMISAGERAGRIVMIGDSDFIRDDLVRGDYVRLGGPYSVLGGAFFSNLLDWLAEDRDLVELQSRATTDRTMKLVEDPAPGTDPRIAEQALAQKTTLLRIVNIVLPGALLAGFGLVVFLVRRAQKRTFLESIG